jgi:hypothetical protein
MVSVNSFQIHRFSAVISTSTSSFKISNQRRQQQSKLYLGSEFERSTPKPAVVEAKEEAEEEKVKPEEPRNEISNSMKDKLRKELISQGADPNYSAGPVLGNPILLISGVVAILVLLGGKGFFF